MAKSIPSQAEAKMLRWGRKTAGMSEEDVAAALDRDVSEIRQWEAGNAEPTFAQLRRLAKLFKRPVAVFYLPEPPRDFTVIKDFRRLASGQSTRYSPELRFAIRSMQARQEWLEERLVARGDKRLTFVGAVTLNDGAAEVGQQLRKLLGVTMRMQSAQSDKNAAFRFWRECCEQVGVFVLLSRTVDLSEMRGFALPHPHAPMAVVNAKDAYAGRTFTLLHEMVHIMLGIEGVSDRNVVSNPRNDDQTIEVFCNAAAAEALVPSADFVARVDGLEDPVDSIPTLANTYRVSDEVIARRMLDHGIIKAATYELKRLEYAARVFPRNEDDDREIRIPRSRMVISTVGKSFARTALNAFQDNDITGGELSDLLDMKLQHLPRFESDLFPSSINAYGTED